MSAPTTPPRIVAPGDSGHTLLRRVMKVRSKDREIERIVLVDQDDLRIALRDTGSNGTSPEESIRDTAIHLLWALDDDAARLTVGDRETPIAPGDMVVLPAGASWQASAGMILCEIEGRPSVPRRVGTGSPPLPTHGTETFHGYNRETTYPAPPGLTISRWKITQPQELPPSPHERFIIDLAAPVAMVWPRGTDLIGRGECRRIPPGTGPITLLPDGLGYALVVDVAPFASPSPPSS